MRSSEPRRKTRELSDECLVDGLIFFCLVPTRVTIGIRHRRKTHDRLRAPFSRTAFCRGDLEAVDAIGTHSTLARKPDLANKRPRLLITQRHIVRSKQSPPRKKLAQRLSQRSGADVQKHAAHPRKSRQDDPLEDRVWEPPRSILFSELPSTTYDQKVKGFYNAKRRHQKGQFAKHANR